MAAAAKINITKQQDTGPTVTLLGANISPSSKFYANTFISHRNIQIRYGGHTWIFNEDYFSSSVPSCGQHRLAYQIWYNSTKMAEVDMFLYFKNGRLPLSWIWTIHEVSSTRCIFLANRVVCLSNVTCDFTYLPFWLKMPVDTLCWAVLGHNNRRGGLVLTPTNSFWLFGFLPLCHFCENQSKMKVQTDRRTDAQMHAKTVS